MLREYDGRLNFATDAWSSPNHKAFIALSVHLEHDGIPIAMILDVVEVAEVKLNWTYCNKAADMRQSHSGMVLAEAFANVLREFGIDDKVSTVCSKMCRILTYLHTRC